MSACDEHRKKYYFLNLLLLSSIWKRLYKLEQLGFLGHRQLWYHSTTTSAGKKGTVT